MSGLTTQQINFLDLLPKQEIEQLSLERALLVIGTGILLLLLNSILNYITSSELQKNLQQYTQQSQRLNNRIAELDILTETRQLDTSLNQTLKNLGLLQRDKQQLLEHLNSGALGSSTGFAWLLQDLSNFHHQGISLQHIYFEAPSMDLRLEGNTQDRNSIASYIKQLTASKNLSGSRFSEFAATNTEEVGIINFTLASKRGGD